MNDQKILVAFCRHSLITILKIKKILKIFLLSLEAQKFRLSI